MKGARTRFHTVASLSLLSLTNQPNFMPKEKEPNFLQRNLGFACLLFVLPPLLSYALNLGLPSAKKMIFLSYPITTGQGNKITQDTSGRPVPLGTTLYATGLLLFGCIILFHFVWLVGSRQSTPSLIAPSFSRTHHFSTL